MNLLNSLDSLDMIFDRYIGEDVCDDTNMLRGIKIVGILIRLAKLFVPMIIVIMGSVTFFKAVTSNKQEEIIHQGKNLGFRVLIGVLVFFLPTIIDSILMATNILPEEYTKCEKCLLDTDQCNP